jgi:hypothetical protein
LERKLASFNADEQAERRPVCFAMPCTDEGALRIAITVAQAEPLELCGELSYRGSEIADITPAGTLREIVIRHGIARNARENFFHTDVQSSAVATS